MADWLVFSQMGKIPQFYIFHFPFYIPAARRVIRPSALLLGRERGNGREENERGSVN